MYGTARGPYEMSPWRIMPFVSTNIPNVNTVTQLSRTPRTLDHIGSHFARTSIYAVVYTTAVAQVMNSLT